MVARARSLGAALARRSSKPRKPAKLTKAQAKKVFRAFKGYKPHPKQRALHQCGARFVVVCAGRRSGKTFSLTREFMHRVLSALARRAAEVKAGKAKRWKRPRRLGAHVKPTFHYWVVAPTYDLCAASKREIFEVLGGEDGPLVLKWNASDNELWLRGGALIEFKSAQYPERLVSVGLDGMLIDEAARLKADVWRENLMPVVNDHEGWCLMATTPLGQNWFYTDIWQLTQLSTDKSKINPAYRAFHFTTMDNSAKPNLVREALQAKKDLPEANWRRNYAADFFAFEGKIYDMYFDDETHLFRSAQTPRTFPRLIAGIDWGYRNPGSIIPIGITSDDAMFVIGEEYQSGLTVAPPPDAPADADSWARRVVEWARRGVQVFYADPAQPNHIDTCRRALRYAGLSAVVLPAVNDVVAGIDAVAMMLQPIEDGDGYKSPALYVSEDARNLRRELSTYQWGRGEAPKKEDDHACDALRYAVISEHSYRKKGLARLQQYDALNFSN